MKEIASAFIKAKKVFSPATKASTNPHFRSKYADLANCFEAVNDALLDNEIAVYQETFEDDTGVTVETVFLHSSGETIRGGKFHVPASKQDPQGYGSALTYARRYSLMTACGIAAEDDDGNSASGNKDKPAPKAPQKAPEQGASGFDDLEDTFLQKFRDATDNASLSAVMNSIPAADRSKYTKPFNERLAQLKKA